ncbi:MAG: S8 family serine peptidase [Actinomycetia bacterium]|nr:S8 family serine peptidase [Actinomycetes bacterium]MCP5031542.1 S8 family serine peptidase [Actinomycetes bacterium]
MTDHKLAWSRESGVLRLPVSEAKDFSPEWAFGHSSGRGVRIAVIDSGIEAGHPALTGAVDMASSIEFRADTHGKIQSRIGPHDDVYGHGTACAGIIHALAPEATIVSVRVLDEGLRGTASAFHAGLTWAVDHEFEVINLSLGAAKRDWALAFHDTCDRGYFANSFIVTAANNVNRDSFPSLFASVTSVASNNSADPLRFHFNPEPPTEFLARGIDVEVPWRDGSMIVTTGNSFAAPHIAGLAALIKAEHPELRPFQIKTALWASAANVREATKVDRAGRGTRVTMASRSTLRTSHHQGHVRPVGSQQSGGRQPTDRQSHRSTSIGPQRSASLGPLAGMAPMINADRILADADAERAEIQRLMVDYDVGDLVARGPWGPVFTASRDGVPIALRRLDPTLAFDRPTRDRFTASVRIAASLEHPHILPILELREDEHFAVIATPLCPSSLADRQRSSQFTVTAAVGAVISLLGGLHHAHAAGIFHGDLRPENALIDDDERVLLSDVGIAAALTSDIRTSSAPTNPLSWAYLASEQLEGGAIGAYTDTHAAGLILYELTSGALPHPPVADLGALVRQRAKPTPRSLRDLAPHVSPPIAAVAEQAVADQPVERFSSARAMAEALDGAAIAAFGSGWHQTQPFVVSAETLAIS